MKIFGAISLRITQEEIKVLEQLKKKGISIIEIFRQGLALCQKAEHKPLKVPAKIVRRAKEIVR